MRRQLTISSIAPTHDSDLSVIIPSYNGRDVLRRCLERLRDAAPNAEVIVVDGRSADRSAEMVREEFPNVTLLEFANHGWGHATNRGIEASTRSLLMLMNSDLFVTREAIVTMVSRLRSVKEVGLVAPILMNTDGSRQRSFGNLYYVDFLPVIERRRVPLVNAACMMTRRDVVRSVGGFDENLFLYNEELDWCTRLRRQGYAIELLSPRVVHIGGASTRRAPELAFEERRGFLYVAAKHYPGVVTELARLAMQFQGWTYSRTDPRPHVRALWARQLEQAKRGELTRSHFPVSGRGLHPEVGAPGVAAAPREIAPQTAARRAQRARPQRTHLRLVNSQT